MTILDASGFEPFGLGPKTALKRLELEPLRKFQGQRDLIWIKPGETYHASPGSEYPSPPLP
jgi:hypothetical protein